MPRPADCQCSTCLALAGASVSSPSMSTDVPVGTRSLSPPTAAATSFVTMTCAVTSLLQWCRIGHRGCTRTLFGSDPVHAHGIACSDNSLTTANPALEAVHGHGLTV